MFNEIKDEYNHRHLLVLLIALVEKRRREKIKDHIEELKALVPGSFDMYVRILQILCCLLHLLY